MFGDDFDKFFDNFVARFFEIGPFATGKQSVKYKGTGMPEISLEGNIPVAIVSGKNYIKILAIVPGAEKNDISVEVVGNTIEIEANVKGMPITESEKVMYSDFPLSEKLYRKISISGYKFDPDKVKASYDKGLLVVTCERVKGNVRKIDIE